MEVNNIYYQKYLKYKYKYIELKKLTGGAIMCVGEGRRGCLLECTKFSPSKEKNNLNLIYCKTCSHTERWHEKIKKV